MTVIFLPFVKVSLERIISPTIKSMATTIRIDCTSPPDNQLREYIKLTEFITSKTKKPNTPDGNTIEITIFIKLFIPKFYQIVPPLTCELSSL